MSFRNIKLVLKREVIDQLRDRRMIFMIFVLPVLLYPFLGVCFMQISQFSREKSSNILILSPDSEETLRAANGRLNIPLLDEEPGRFKANLFADETKSHLIQLSFREASKYELEKTAETELEQKEFDAILTLPQKFLDDPENGVPKVVFSTARENSMNAGGRLERILERWNKKLGEDKLKDAGLSPKIVNPLTYETRDIAEKTQFQGASLWSKILPIMLVLWALTGAFYPSIDLCAGEKERGTLETLLCSPAKRSEIVLGKLGTVVIFSALTAILNVISIGFAGWLLLSQLPGISTPPQSSMFWLILALGPVSILFSSLCIALAAFAKSSKEGQYYLTPLMLIVMPLSLLPFSPGVELNLGNSMIPITGIILLLGQCLEGNYLFALRYAPVVTGVTLLCCWIAIRWAIGQFKSESVLFRESEKFSIGAFVRHTLTHKKEYPSFFMGILCAMLILALKYFAGFVFTSQEDFGEFLRNTLTLQVVAILLPPVIMAFVLTTNPVKTLRLNAPISLWSLPLAVLLAFTLHPVIVQLGFIIQYLYPISPEVEAAVTEMTKLFKDVSIIDMLLIGALCPAICEELAFRGFILSGLERNGKWQAIVLSAVFFGIVHSILQQSIAATFVGCLLGYLAIKTGSIYPCMLYHLTHNGLASIVSFFGKKETETEALEEPYAIWITILGLLLSTIILYAIHHLNKNRESALRG